MQNRIIDIKMNTDGADLESLVPLSVLKKALVIDHDEDDSIIERLRISVFASFQLYTKNVFVADTNITVTANVKDSCFAMPRIPVTDILEVSIKTAPNSYEALDADQYELLGNELILEKTGIIKISCVAGHPDLPSPIYDAIVAEIVYRYENRNDKQLSAEYAGQAEILLTPFIYRAYP